MTEGAMPHDKKDSRLILVKKKKYNAKCTDNI